MYYVGLNRVTTIDGVYITDLSESKIAVKHDVKDHMQQLCTDRHTKLSNTPIYELDPNTSKICFLNSGSLHEYIEDTRSDLNYSDMDINIFSEKRLYHLDSNASYAISGYTIFQNVSESSILTTRPFGGTAVYTKIPFMPGYPLAKNTNGVEITIIYDGTGGSQSIFIFSQSSLIFSQSSFILSQSSFTFSQSSFIFHSPVLFFTVQFYFFHSPVLFFAQSSFVFFTVQINFLHSPVLFLHSPFLFFSQSSFNF